MAEDNKVKSIHNETKETMKGVLSFQTMLMVLLLLMGTAGLGLMDWADLDLVWENADAAFFTRTLLKVLSYGMILLSMSVWKIDKLKKTSAYLADILKFLDTVRRYYRPEYLRKYVDRDNYREKKRRFVEKYKDKLAKLERDAAIEYGLLWDNYLKEHDPYTSNIDIKKDTDEDGKSYLDKYFYPMYEYNDRRLKKMKQGAYEYWFKKIQYLKKINDPDKYMQYEDVNFDPIEVDDLIMSHNKRNGYRRVPRQKESVAMVSGAIQILAGTLAGTILTTILIMDFQDGGVEAIVNTLFTLFFAIISAYRGLMNGERVFEQVTLNKKEFQQKHLHEYTIMESKEHRYIVGPEKVPKNIKKEGA